MIRPMAALGDLLALVHDAASRACPAQLTVTEWRHGPRSADAWEAFMRARHGSGFVRAADPTPDTLVESRWSVRLSYDGHDRYREESAGRQAGVRYLVRNGARWLTWDSDWGLVSSESEPEGGPPTSSFGFLLDPVGLLAAFRFDQPTVTALAGRPALATRAVPRPGDGSSSIFRVGPGADVVELVFDAETGALLRSEAMLAHEPFHRLEVTEIAYVKAPRETFSLEPPEGHIGPPGPWARPVALPLHDLASRAPFAVLVPRRIPDGWRLGAAQLLDHRDHPPVEATAFLDYGSLEGAYSVGIRERSSETQDAPVDVVDNGPTVGPRFTVTLVRSGTWVELSGNERELLLDLARELVPAPTEPPRL
jgi:hypothetical protein